MKKYVNQYVNGCNSCQRVKPSLLKPFGTLEPLPIPAGPWTDISYDMITNLPTSRGFDCILTVIDRLTKMAHFLPCNKKMTAEQLADLMLQQVWKLHGTPKTIVLDQGSVFVSQIMRELNKQLGIWLQPSTAYHPRTNGQSKIANKVVEQYLRHFVQYWQDDWEPLLALAELAYNNADHSSSGVSPFKANFGFDPTYGEVPYGEQCIPVVEARLKQIEEVQAELRCCLEGAQEAIK
jgi:transposase InsO family protein